MNELKCDFCESESNPENNNQDLCGHSVCDNDECIDKALNSNGES